MTPKVIVTDLDRTLTGADLVPDPRAIERIDELRAAGVRVVVATGRREREVAKVPFLARVDGVVAENGGIVWLPGEAAREVRAPRFADEARAALGPLATRFEWGRVVGSGPRALARDAADRLRAHGVDHGMEFNADEVMVLPADVDKASGAEICLRRLRLTAADAWAIGDGENDASMLRWAHLGFAPANAASAARAAADVLVAAEYSRAFIEATTPLIDRTLVRS